MDLPGWRRKRKWCVSLSGWPNESHHRLGSRRGYTHECKVFPDRLGGAEPSLLAVLGFAGKDEAKPLFLYLTVGVTISYSSPSSATTYDLMILGSRIARLISMPMPSTIPTKSQAKRLSRNPLKLSFGTTAYRQIWGPLVTQVPLKGSKLMAKSRDTTSGHLCAADTNAEWATAL